LPGGDIGGQPRDSLQFAGLKGCAGDLRFVRQPRGVEEASQRNGDAGAQERAQFGDELVLLLDPGLVGGRTKSDQPVAAYAGDGVAGDKRE